MEPMYTLDIFGGESPEVLIIGGVHGDEPAGRDAINEIKSEVQETNINFNKSVGFLIANPRALREDTRYIEADLNRSFPGNSKSSEYEDRLANEIYNFISSADIVLSLHSTHSSSEPFAILNEDMDPEVAETLFNMSVSKIVVSPFAQERGSLVQYPHTIDIEVGLQKSESSKRNAISLVKQFLVSTGSVSYNSPIGIYLPWTDGIVFLLDSVVKKRGSVELFAENFARVEECEEYAKSENKSYKSEKAFYPVLMSETGYESILGFKSEYLGWFSQYLNN